jgi:predicted component of type VI protein secretion system
VCQDPNAALVLEDDLVSRRHVRISPADGGARVEDLGSRNGTFINDNAIHAPSAFAPGDHVLVGVTMIELRSAPQVAARPTAVRPKPSALAAPPRQADYVPAGVVRGDRGRRGELDSLLDTREKG